MRRSFASIAAPAFILESALFSVLSVLLPHYQEEFGMSTIASGILAAAYTAGMTVGILIAGLWASRRFGVRAVSLSGCGMLAAASVGFGLAGSVVALELFRVVQGLGAGLLWCALVNWLILETPVEQRGIALGAALGAAVFGGATGPLVGAATQVVGTFVVFGAVAVAVLGYSVVIARLAPPEDSMGEMESGLDALGLPPDRALRLVAGLGFVPPLTMAALITLVPLQMANAGTSEDAIAVALFVGALLATACCLIAGSWADRRGNLMPVVVGGAVAACALGAMAPARSTFALALPFVIAEGALSLLWIPLTSTFTSRGEEFGAGAARTALLLNLSITGAYTAGPPIFSAVDAALGDAAAYLLMALVTTVVLSGVLRLRGIFAQRRAGEDLEFDLRAVQRPPAR